MKLEDVEVTVLDNGPGRICGKVKMKLVHRPSKYEVTGEGYSKTILKDKLLEELKQKVEIWEQLLAMYDSYKANIKAKVDMDSYYFVPVPKQTIKGSVGTIQDNATITPNGNVPAPTDGTLTIDALPPGSTVYISTDGKIVTKPVGDGSINHKGQVLEFIEQMDSITAKAWKEYYNRLYRVTL